MIRLPFQIPDYTRWIWTSEEAREAWEPRISRITAAWARVEIASVRDGTRPSALLSIQPNNLPALAMSAAPMAAMPLAQVGLTQSYSATSKPVEQGQPWEYRVVVTHPELIPVWSKAWAESNDPEIGKLLGYPICCQEFFQRIWVAAQHVDTTWPMAENQGGTEGPPETNILLRWLGIRLVPHLPCRFDCADSWQLANGLKKTWEQEGFTQELAWALEMLSWPMEWVALHGIAEIKTPILTINTRTDATADRVAVAKQGINYPAEGAQGLRFPYRIVKDKATRVPSFKRSVTPEHEMNGFATAAAMETAHAMIAAAAGPGPGKILDLGAGTGRLLERLAKAGWTTAGVEADKTRANVAKAGVRHGDLFDPTTWEGEWDLVLLMPGRVEELQPTDPKIETLRAALKTRAKAVLFYAYGDWLRKPGGLDGLTRRTGFGEDWAWKVISETAATTQVQAILAKPARTEVTLIRA